MDKKKRQKYMKKYYEIKKNRKRINKQAQQYYLNHPEKREERYKKRKEKYRRVKREVFRLLGNKCVRCGFSDIRALQLDHIKGGGGIERRKIGSSMYLYFYIIKQLKKGKGFDKYQLLCANCNWIKRSEEKEWYSI